MMRRIAAAVFASMLGFSALAQEAGPADDFGGWGDIQLSKNLGGGFYTSLRAEYRCKNGWSDLDFWYLRPTLGYRFTDWLSAGVCYDYKQYRDEVKHCGLAFVTGTLKSGQLTASLREMYVRSYTFEEVAAVPAIYPTPEIPASTTVSVSSVLRSRLNVQYSDPKTSLKPYLCIEMFSWKSWQNTRHYVGTIVPLCDRCNLDLFYLYLTRSAGTAEHVLGAGLNISL